MGATAHNSSYVLRRLGRRLGLLGAAARLVATSAPRPGWARGRVTYARFVMGNYAKLPRIYFPGLSVPTVEQHAMHGPKRLV
jgi:hypothetical protein